ncbi:MAG TPA: lytic transglycosylase [Rhodobacteraceae bacterium]|nr:lytic transglycosylase [Paracoccaceae bacterium]|tara:strand:+ start:16375 stop:16965 length:591 start_codon:yes stop_codon:yes gene_type:complete
MSSILRALILMTLLAGCSLPSGNVNAPRNLNNACSILDQRRSFFPAFMAAKRKYGVPVSVQMAIIWQESKFKSKAKTPRRYRFGLIPVGRQSSAYGYAQVLDGTWREYKAAAGRWTARRTNIQDSADFIGWYMTQSRRELGISMSDTRNQYLAYHEGRTGYRRGSYKSKRWLLRVAKNLENRAKMYNSQLRRCRKT